MIMNVLWVEEEERPLPTFPEPEDWGLVIYD